MRHFILLLTIMMVVMAAGCYRQGYASSQGDEHLEETERLLQHYWKLTAHGSQVGYDAHQELLVACRTGSRRGFPDHLYSVDTRLQLQGWMARGCSPEVTDIMIRHAKGLGVSTERWTLSKASAILVGFLAKDIWQVDLDGDDVPIFCSTTKLTPMMCFEHVEEVIEEGPVEFHSKETLEWEHVERNGEVIRDLKVQRGNMEIIPVPRTEEDCLRQGWSWVYQRCVRPPK